MYPLTKGEKNLILIALDSQIAIYTHGASVATKELFAKIFKKQIEKCEKIKQKIQGRMK